MFSNGKINKSEVKMGRRVKNIVFFAPLHCPPTKNATGANHHWTMHAQQACPMFNIAHCFPFEIRQNIPLFLVITYPPNYDTNTRLEGPT